MAGFIIEFRDEEMYEELVGKMHKAKKAVCDAYEALEKADNTNMSERGGHYRGDYRRGSYRDGSYRDEEMYERRGRDGMGRFVS